MRRLALAALVLALGAVLTGSASSSPQTSQLTCKYGFKYVTKMVHGHKKRVKVCKKKPAPKPPPPKADLELEVHSTLDQVTAGNHVAYTFVAENHGPNPADGVTIAVDLPPGENQISAYGSSEESSSECEIETSTATHVECHFGTLAAESDEEVGVLTGYAILSIEQEPSQAGNYTVSAKAIASSSTVDPTPQNAAVAKNLLVLAGPPAADLSVAIESPTQPASVPDGYQQTISVTNAGPTEATDIVVTALLPQGASAIVPSAIGLDFLSYLENPCPAFLYGYLSTAIGCFESIPSGATRSTTLNVAPSINSPATLRTDAVVSSYTRDSNLANNRASGEVAVLPFVASPGADLRLFFGDVPKLEAGDVFELPFRLANVGLGDADDVTVGASISPSLSLFAIGLVADSEAVSCSSTDGGSADCRLDEIESDGRVSGTLYSLSIPAGSYTATVTVTSPDLPAPVTKTITFQVT